MDNILEQCRSNIGAVPRTFFTAEQRLYLRTKKPLWCILSADALNTFFTNQETLLRDGVVVWGHTVQANSMLFSPGIINAPGEVVYSTEPQNTVPLSELATIARSLFQLKGRSEHPFEEQRIGDYLANERVRVFGWTVPTSISGSRVCAISSTYFDRKHLPGGRLCQPHFPLLVMPFEPKIVMPLPARFWPKEYADSWRK